MSRISINVLFLILSIGNSAYTAASLFGIFSERLFITSLNNGDLFSSFEFKVNADLNTTEKQPIHIPWLVQDIFEQYSIKGLQLSLTQGYWRTELWGLQQPGYEVPGGTELFVNFEGPEKSVDDRWLRVLHILNGMFCTSMLRIHPSLTVSEPPKISANIGQKLDGFWRYGSLSGESVCTENLKPWKKLLPCKQSGLVSLLEPKNLLASRFHSIVLDVQKSEKNGRVNWDFKLLAVTVKDLEQITRNNKALNFHKIFDRRLMTKCEIADASEIIIETDDKFSLKKDPSKHMNLENRSFAIYDLKQWDGLAEFSLQFTRTNNLKRQHKGFSLHTYAKGTSQSGGQISSKIVNPFDTSINALYTHVVPWQIRVYLHTLTLFCNTSSSPINFTPKYALSRDGEKPLLIEFQFRLPRFSVCKVEFDYEPAFLKIGDFPADANSGIFVQGATLTLDVSDTDKWRRLFTENPAFSPSGALNFRKLKLHGEPLLILLPVPDFSMPFNVICLVSTVIAIFYGNAFTMTTRIMVPVPKKEKTSDEARLTLISRVKLRLTALVGRFRRKPKEE